MPSSKKMRDVGTAKKIVTVKLTSKQQEQIRSESGGKVNITSFKLRPDLQIGKTLEQIAKALQTPGSLAPKPKFSPPPKGSIWC